MKTKEMVRAVLGSCLPVAFLAPPVLAQHTMVMPPPAIQAIDTHLQQARTREQRDAIESKSVAPVPPRQATHSQPGGAVKNPVATKPREAPSTIRDLDDQALFDRPEPIRAEGKSRRRTTK